MKRRVSENTVTLLRLNKEINSLINDQMQAQIVINRQGLVREMELEKRIVESSDDLLEIVPSKSLFSFMPNFGSEKHSNFRNV